MHQPTMNPAHSWLASVFFSDAIAAVLSLTDRLKPVFLNRARVDAEIVGSNHAWSKTWFTSCPTKCWAIEMVRMDVGEDMFQKMDGTELTLETVM